MMQISELLKEYRLPDVKAVDMYGDSLLHLVMKSEQFSSEQVAEYVRILLNEGVDPNIKNKKNETVLHLAITQRAEDVIDCLLTCKVELDHSIAHYLIEEESIKFEVITEDPLQISDFEMQMMEDESASFVEWIVSKGLDIDDVHEKYCKGPCALMSAIDRNLQHIIATLTKYTKDINFIKKDGDPIDHTGCNHEEDLKGTVLHLFLDRIGNYRKYYYYEPKKTWYTHYTDRYAASIVKTMIDKGVSTAVVNGFGNTALHEAVYRKENINIVEILIEHTTNFNHKNNEGKTPFHIIINKWLEPTETDVEYYMKILRALIEKGADVNEPSTYGSSPLFNAVERKNMKVITFLRDFGADFSLVPAGGASLMHLLVKTGYHEIEEKRAAIELLDFLVSNGCPVNAKEKQHLGKTPLHVAANDGSVDFVRELINHGADVNCKNDRGYTPLHYLCEYSIIPLCQKLNMAEILLEFGANVNAMNSEGDTPMHLIASSTTIERPAELIQFLLEHGANMDLGFSVIHRAIWKDYNKDSWGAAVTDILNIPELLDCIEDYISDESEVLLRHWIKIDAAKLKYRVRGHIDEDLKNLTKIKKYKLIYQECLDEVEVLKSDFIDIGVSLYTYLHMDPISRRTYIHNEKLAELVNSPKIEKQLPEYAALILASYRESVTHKLLFEPVKVAWLEITEFYLPDICIEQIFSFLDTLDWFKFIETVE